MNLKSKLIMGGVFLLFLILSIIITGNVTAAKYNHTTSTSFRVDILLHDSYDVYRYNFDGLRVDLYNYKDKTKVVVFDEDGKIVSQFYTKGGKEE